MTKNMQAELTEDMEVVGPGQMLKEARIALKLTKKEVAQKLNFTTALIDSIENEEFNNRLPTTYTRGYLKNYAKLVNVACEDVLASYELLGVAAVQQAEMQSFSQITKKQAENSRLMWFSYLILAFLIALTVIWWQQEHQQNQNANDIVKAPKITVKRGSVEPQSVNEEALAKESKATNQNNIKSQTALANTPSLPTANQETINNNQAEGVSPSELEKNQQASQITHNENTQSSLSQQRAEPTTSAAPITANMISAIVFTFNGDCWVNIYDATGERVAWGIKKADYIMNIKGQAPFSITLGKPELVSINYNGAEVDMSQFGAGNIAKFTLPLTTSH